MESNWAIAISIFSFYVSVSWCIGFAYVTNKIFIEIRENDDFSLVYVFYFFIHMALLLLWIVSDIRSTANFIFPIILGITIIINTIISAFVGHKVEKNMEGAEAPYLKNKYSAFVARMLVIIHAAISMAVAGSVVSSTAYHTTLANYKLRGDLEKLVEHAKKEKQNNQKYLLTVCQRYLNFLDNTNASNIVLNDNLFSFFSGTYTGTLMMGDGRQIIAEFDKKHGNRSLPVTTYLLTLKSKAYEKCIVNIDLMNGPKIEENKVINVSYIRLRIQDKLNENAEIILNLEKLPPVIVPFAFAVFYQLLGGINLSYEPDGVFAERLELISRWFFYLLNGVVFYLVLKPSNNGKSEKLS